MRKYENHGMYNSKLYKSWCNMKSRCNNPKATNYDRYGGRGIEICKEWNESFESFRDWSYKNGYKEGLQIERVDNEGDYEPKNCCWVTHGEQMNNTSQNHFLTIGGKTKTIREWARLSGISESTVHSRLKLGYKDKDLISNPFSKKKEATINGETKSLIDWSKETGIKETTIYYRYRKGIRGEELIEPVK